MDWIVELKRLRPPLRQAASVAFASGLGLLVALTLTAHLTSAQAALASLPVEAREPERLPENSLNARRGWPNPRPADGWGTLHASGAYETGSESEPEPEPISDSDTITLTGPDLAVTGLSLLSRTGLTASIAVTVTNQGVSPTLGPDSTGWFGTDLYVKPVGDPAPTGPGDRYLGACPTITNYCPADIRWPLYRVVKESGNAGLDAGESWVIVYTTSFPTADVYWLYAQADTFWGENGDPDGTLFGSSEHGRIVEGDNTNNIFGPAPIDMRFPPVYLPVVMNAYDSRQHVYLPTIRRGQSNIPAPFTLQLYMSSSPPEHFSWVTGAGARWVRIPAWWAWIEPINTTPDQYNWAVLDPYVQAATASDIRLILTIEDNPAWAAATPGGPVNNLADLQEFVAVLVARYPQVEYWELYNEPDAYGRYGGKAGEYAQMLQAVYPVIKSANPRANVVLGGLALDWFQSGFFDPAFLTTTLTTCAGASCFDVMNFHYYPPFRHVWEPYGRDIVGKTNFVRQILATHGYSQPVISTESSWASGAQWGTPELQARYVPKLYARSYAADLSVSSWFALLDADLSESGLLGLGLTPRPAYYVYQTMATIMNGARYVRAIPSAETGSVRIEGYEFTVPGPSEDERLDLYWYDCPLMVNPGKLPVECEDTLPLNLQASRVAMTDKLGSTVVVNDDDGDGRVTVVVGSSPIYLDYNP